MASVAQLLLATGRAQCPYIATQGARVERSGRIHVSQDDNGDIWVGGNTRTLVEGHIDIAL